MLGQLKLPSQNKPVLALLIHDIPLRNIVEPLLIVCTSRYVLKFIVGYELGPRETCAARKFWWALSWCWTGIVGSNLLWNSNRTFKGITVLCIMAKHVRYRQLYVGVNLKTYWLIYSMHRCTHHNTSILTTKHYLFCGLIWKESTTGKRSMSRLSSEIRKTIAQ